MAGVPFFPVRSGLLEGGVSRGDALQVDGSHRVPVMVTERFDGYGSIGLVLTFVILCTSALICTPNFLAIANLVNLIRQISINGILTVGPTFVLFPAVSISRRIPRRLHRSSAAQFAHPGQYRVLVPVLAGVCGASCGGLNSWWSRWRHVVFIVARYDHFRAQGLALIEPDGRPVSNLSRNR